MSIISVSCCVCGIDRTEARIQQLWLHRFPANSEISNLWAKKIGNNKILATSAQKRSRKYFVCSKHFQLSMFYINNRLKRKAVPTLELTPSQEVDESSSSPIFFEETFEVSQRLSSPLKDLEVEVNIPIGVECVIRDETEDEGDLEVALDVLDCCRSTVELEHSYSAAQQSPFTGTTKSVEVQTMLSFSVPKKKSTDHKVTMIGED